MTNDLSKKILVFGAGILLLSVAVTPLVSSDVIKPLHQYLDKLDKNVIVNPTGVGTIIVPDDYPTIQGAIDHANNGDTILVRAGVYHENVIVDKMLDIIGDDCSNTTIDGGGTGTVVKTTSDGVKIAGFTIRNSGSSDPGIHLASHYNNVSYNVITGNFYGLKLFPSTGNQIIHNYIIDNDGDGLWLSHSHQNTIEDNFIMRNGNNGISANYSSLSNHIEHNYIAENTVNGINIAETSFGSITKLNTITSNAVGLKTTGGSDNNLFYQNNMSTNVQNANDNSMNSYDDGSIGNYWDDYDGVDNDGDGIGDTAYGVPGGSNNDNKPRVDPPPTNFEPFKPSRPWGPMKGKVGTMQTFYATIIDPEGDDVYCMFDWGDGFDSGWIGPYNSGETITDGHIWILEGNYAVRVRGKDIHDHVSLWSEPVPFQAPKTRNLDDQVHFFNLFHRLFPLFDTDKFDMPFQKSPFFFSLFTKDK